jgi:hypothetical protein
MPAPITITFIKSVFPQPRRLAQLIGLSRANIRTGTKLASRVNCLA